MFESTREILVAMATLHEEASTLRKDFPLLVALLSDTDRLAVGEHESQGNSPLFDHAYRALEILGAIENQEEVFPGPLQARDELASLAKSLSPEWMTSIRQALVFMDVTKGGDRKQRANWMANGIDLSVHNFASADLVSKETELESKTIELIRWHGTLGQFTRGEVPWESFEQIPSDDHSFLNAYFILNVCDTAAVRDDLLDEKLWPMFRSSMDLIYSNSKVEYDSQIRSERFARLRRSRGEGQSAAGQYLKIIEELPSSLRNSFEKKFDLANFWYCESALANLSIRAHLKAIAFVLGTLESVGIFHVSFHKISLALNTQNSAGRYRTRLLESMFSRISFEKVLMGKMSSNMLVGIELEYASEKAIEVDWGAREEADALVTLLTIYEKKSSVKFHALLKMLCDLYDLRKDTFDRVSNEQEYLDNMNSARSDKARMLDYVSAGTIVEVGPGGGVVLDLLAERFQKSEVYGVDISEEVVNELTKKKEEKNSSWSVVFGDAYELPRLFPTGFDSVIFCSLLHEIYSYVENEDAKKFQLASIEKLLRASYRGLRQGGRIIIRDGVAPPAGQRIIRFLDPEGPAFLRLFVEQFEGLDIDADWLDETSAKMSTHHAMEFLYCYTWGPSSFPYEVREQYGVLEYRDYVQTILAWLSEEDSFLGSKVKVVEIPQEHQSYLQSGYRDGLSSKIILLDGEFRPVELPDSNCLMVFEKT